MEIGALYKEACATLFKKFQNKEEASLEAFKNAQVLLDRAATKGLIHKNKAARHKSRLCAKIKALAA